MISKLAIQEIYNYFCQNSYVLPKIVFFIAFLHKLIQFCRKYQHKTHPTNIMNTTKVSFCDFSVLSHGLEGFCCLRC